VAVDLTSFLDTLELPACVNTFECYVTGSEVQRWGLGVVQEIDSAAMHLFASWQHQELEIDLVGFGGDCGGIGDGCRRKQGFDDWDLFQVGGIIFF
jgi:hypothetical protein